MVLFWAKAREVDEKGEKGRERVEDHWMEG